MVLYVGGRAQGEEEEQQDEEEEKEEEGGKKEGRQKTACRYCYVNEVTFT